MRGGGRSLRSSSSSRLSADRRPSPPRSRSIVTRQCGFPYASCGRKWAREAVIFRVGFRVESHGAGPIQNTAVTSSTANQCRAADTGGCQREKGITPHLFTPLLPEPCNDSSHAAIPAPLLI